MGERVLEKNVFGIMTNWELINTDELKMPENRCFEFHHEANSNSKVFVYVLDNNIGSLEIKNL